MAAAMAEEASDASLWVRLKHGNEHRCYLKRHLCPMRWQLDEPLGSLMSAVMEGGGPIATLSGECGSANNARMSVYSGSGEAVSSWEWHFGRVRALGWTGAEELVAVLERGHVLLWSLLGTCEANFSLGEAIEQQGVLMCETYADGLVVLTTSFKLYALLSFTHRQLVPLADTRLATPPTAMAVLGRGAGSETAAATACPEVVLATASRTILLVDEHHCHDQLLTSGPFIRLAPSPNGKFIAAFAASGALLVISSDFSRHLSEISTHVNRPPRQLVWCGADSILVLWERLLLMVGPYADSVKYEYASPPLLHTEVDGVRIIAEHESELLQRVPEPTEQVFMPGSLAPAARLLEASTAFDQGSARSDELLQSLDGELPAAVTCCIHAARYEPAPSSQKRLLRAAAFGKAWVPNEVDNALLASTCATLRVLNALRAPHVGVALTWSQYAALGAPRLLNRLLVTHAHELAWKLADGLRLPAIQAAVTLHWCRSTIRDAPATLADAALLEQLRGKLTMGARTKAVPRVAEVAEEAHRVGRVRLATALLDEFETAPAQQIPLLLTMGELSAALGKALACSDTELTHLVLLHAKGALAEADFFDMLFPQPVAQDLLAAYCRAREPELLKTLYYHVNRPADAAGLAIREAYKATTWAQRMRGLSIALQFYEHSAANLPQLAKATEEQLKLLDVQRQLERDTRGVAPPPGAPPAVAMRFKFIDTPLNETLYKCLAYGQAAVAERLRVDCKVPERRWWRLKITGLSHARNWPALFELGSARRSPIGFKPFVDACIAQGAYDEAARYVPKLPPAEAVPVYLQIGKVDDARRIALQHKEKQPQLLELCLQHAQEASSKT